MRHVPLMVEQLGLEGAKDVKTPVVPEKQERRLEGDDEELEREEAHIYRSVIARGTTYLRTDTTDGLLY